MSECVVRMEIPENCLKCPLRNQCEIFCDWFWHIVGRAARKPYPKPFDKGCRIVCQLPKGHGPLVDSEEDASKYITVWDCNCSEFGRQTVMAVEDLQYLPIIVPAERKDDEN